MSTMVRVPGMTLAQMGYHLRGKAFDVIELALDRKGRAYDQRTRKYLKISKTQMSTMIAVSASHDAWLSLGAPDGKYTTVYTDDDTGEVYLTPWSPTSGEE